MGFDVKSGVSSVPPKSGGLVKRGFHAARLVDCAISDSPKYFHDDGTPKQNFAWDVEIFNADGENAYVRIWTGMTLHPKSHLVPLTVAIFGDVKKAPSDTDEYLGRPFTTAVNVFTIETDEGEKKFNRATKPVLYEPWEEDDPFEPFVLGADAPDEDDEAIPF